MPASKKMLKAAQMKANRAAGLGDADGRMTRVKTSAPKIKCTICSVELLVTKTCTEMKSHSDKEGKPLEECFPGAEKQSAALVEKAAKGKGGKAGKVKGGLGKKGGPKATAAERKASEAAMFAMGGKKPKKKSGFGAKKKKKKDKKPKK